MFRLGQMRQCQPPYFSTPPGSANFIDDLGSCSPCPSGLVWSTVSQDCVVSIDVTGDQPPATTGPNFWLYAIGGAFLLMLLSFAGGRASKRSKPKSSSSRLISRTTTRSEFA